MERKTISTYLILTICSQLGMSFIAATYVIFLMAKGLDLFSVNLVNFVFFVTMFLAEIPTGAIADMFGRKKAFIASCLLFAVSMLVYGVSGTLAGFMLAEGIGALGRSFCNGAFEAWLTDNLALCNCQGKLQSVLVKEKVLTGFMVIAGSLLGPILAQRNLSFPWFAASISFVITAILAMIIMKEGKFHSRKLDLKGHFNTFTSRVSSGISYARGSKVIRFIIFVTALQVFSMQATNMQWAPFFLGKTGSTVSLGAIKVGINLFIAFGAVLTGLILRLSKSEKRALIVSQSLIGVFVLLSVAFGSLLPALSYFFTHEILRGAFQPLKRRFMQDNIKVSSVRATVGSVDSMISNMAGAVGLLLFGFIAQSSSITLSWILAGGLLVAGTLFASRMKLD